ncbi:MAG: hypothetical protein ACJ739_08955 [Acidimicrobiales bacterium]
MRARRGLIIGWVIVGVYAAALVTVAVTTEDGDLRPGDRAVDGDATHAFVDAWERSLRATFVRSGTFERRSETTGASITSEDLLAQRPPRRVHRQLGGVQGRDDQRMILCPAAPEGGEAPECSFGDPEGPTYDQDVDATMANLRALVEGANPVYAVQRADDGCFELAQLRVEPRAPFGVDARFCFDDATGAPTDTRIRYAGGIVEVLAITKVSGTVHDADLEP